MDRVPNGDDSEYERALHRAQVELVKYQKHVIKSGQKVLLIFEGRDAAGKDDTIKRIVQHLSPTRNASCCPRRPVEPRPESLVFSTLCRASSHCWRDRSLQSQAILRLGAEEPRRPDPDVRGLHEEHEDR